MALGKVLSWAINPLGKTVGGLAAKARGGSFQSGVDAGTWFGATGGLVAGGQDKAKRKVAEEQAGKSRAEQNRNALQQRKEGFQKSENDRKSILRRRTETIKTSPLGVSGSMGTTGKRSLLGG